MGPCPLTHGVAPKDGKKASKSQGPLWIEMLGWKHCYCVTVHFFKPFHSRLNNHCRLLESCGHSKDQKRAENKKTFGNYEVIWLHFVVFGRSVAHLPTYFACLAHLREALMLMRGLLPGCVNFSVQPVYACHFAHAARPAGTSWQASTCWVASRSATSCSLLFFATFWLQSPSLAHHQEAKRQPRSLKKTMTLALPLLLRRLDISRLYYVVGILRKTVQIHVTHVQWQQPQLEAAKASLKRKMVDKTPVSCLPFNMWRTTLNVHVFLQSISKDKVPEQQMETPGSSTDRPIASWTLQ